MKKENINSVDISRNARFTKRSLKHFAESRIRQGNVWGEILYLLNNVHEVAEDPELNILNPKQEKHPGSVLLGKFYKSQGKAIIIILDKGKEPRDIISLHFKKKSDFYRLAS